MSELLVLALVVATLPAVPALLRGVPYDDAVSPVVAVLALVLVFAATLPITRRRRM